MEKFSKYSGSKPSKISGIDPMNKYKNSWFSYGAYLFHALGLVDEKKDYE